VESPADISADTRTNADADNRGRAPTDLTDWRAGRDSDRLPLTDDEAARGKAGLAEARAALRARRTGA
jgi:hypothetical protein